MAVNAQNTPVAVEVVEELTEAEAADHRLESRLKEFYEAGKSLIELRDRRLYRSTHKTFEEYCRDRFGFTRRSSDYLIAGSLVVDNLRIRTNSSQILPSSETQCRPLTQLKPEQQFEVWQQAVATSWRQCSYCAPCQKDCKVFKATEY